MVPLVVSVLIQVGFYCLVLSALSPVDWLSDSTEEQKKARMSDSPFHHEQQAANVSHLLHDSHSVGGTPSYPMSPEPSVSEWDLHQPSASSRPQSVIGKHSTGQGGMHGIALAAQRQFGLAHQPLQQQASLQVGRSDAPNQWSETVVVNGVAAQTAPSSPLHRGRHSFNSDAGDGNPFDEHGPQHATNPASLQQPPSLHTTRMASGSNTPHSLHLSNGGGSGTGSSSSTSGGFNGSTAREFFRSHLKAIAFTARLSHMAGGRGGEDGADAVGPGPGEMSEEQFTRMAESLGREESLVTLRSMYQSLQQFRTLLVESRTLASSELQKEETFNRIVTRVRSVIQAEAVVLMMLDRNAETFYSCATTSPTGHIPYQHGLTHSFCGHVLRYKSSLNLRYSANKDPRFDPDLSRRLGNLQFRSVLAVPVFNKNNAILAVMLCINKRNSSKSKEQYFSEQDQSLVEFISMLAGYRVENVPAVRRGRHQTTADRDASRYYGAHGSRGRLDQGDSPYGRSCVLTC